MRYISTENNCLCYTSTREKHSGALNTFLVAGRAIRDGDNNDFGSCLIPLRRPISSGITLEEIPSDGSSYDEAGMSEGAFIVKSGE